ncbi:MAG TPA: hypothetical protein VMU95_17195 [Trebonia sp.]|nr:hypothetical protein [Trebonia sp.]
MEPTPTLARAFWTAIEPIHSVVYFAPEPIAAMKSLGLRGFWMGYFAGRFAPLGALGPAPVAAMCYSFAPALVARAIPDAWRYASPSACLEARVSSAAAALRAHVPAAMLGSFKDLAAVLWTAVEGCQFEGRPLAAGWASATRPADPDSDPVASAWLAASVLREHRGDGHVMACVGAGLRGLDASVTHVATGTIPRALIQPTRGWTDADWTSSERRLQARGLLDSGGRLTKSGGALRRDLESLTDRLAAGPVERLGETGVKEASALAAPIARALIDAGVIPLPNPVGVPRP